MWAYDPVELFPAPDLCTIKYLSVMGKLKNGAFGHLTGRIGNLICYTLNGQNITREIGTITKAPTEKKLATYDRTMLLLYFPQGIDASGQSHAIWELNGTKRRDGFDFIALDPNEIGKPFEAYIAFISDDRLQVSDSIWVEV
jgi:hypothetical protein